MPPGDVEFHFRSEAFLLDINSLQTEGLQATNSDRMVDVIHPTNSYALLPPSTEFRLTTVNESWGSVIEADPARLTPLFAEMLDHQAADLHFIDYTPMPQIAHFGRMLTAHLRGPQINPLYVEGLGIAVLGLALQASYGSAISHVSTKGTDARIDRALDYIEAHLADDLSVAELAEIACMSPWHFSRCFRDRTGEAPYQWVLHRRTDRATEMILTTRLPFPEIAWQCRFGDQSHLGRAIKAATGMTPSQLRER